MQKNSTLNNKLISYLYNECDVLDQALVDVELDQNQKLDQTYYQLKDSIDLLDSEVKLQSPSIASVQMIEMIGSLRLNSTIAKS